MTDIQDGEPDAHQYNTKDPLNEAGKPVQPGTEFHDEDPEYLPDEAKDSVWGEVDANNPTA